MRNKIITSIILLFFVCLIMNINIYQNYNLHPTFSFKTPSLMSFSQEFHKADNETKFYNISVSGSNCAAVAEFVEYYTENDLHIWSFKLVEEIYGKVPEKIIKTVSTNIGDNNFKNSIQPNTFEKGKNYILLLYRDESIFLDTAQYGIMGNVYIPIDDLRNSKYSCGEIDFGFKATKENVVNYFKNMASTRGTSIDDFQTKVFKGETLEKVVKNSDAVFKVTVKSKIIDARLAKQSTYEVEINEVLSGEKHLSKNATGTLLHVEKNSLEIGSTYIITLSLYSEAEKQSAFVQSSLNGIIPIDETETIKSIYNWLKD